MIGVDADRQVRGQLLLDAQIVIVVAFGERHVVLARQVERCSGEQGLGLAGDQFIRRRREIAGIAAMNRHPLKRRPHEIQARAELIFLAIGFELVVTQAIIDRQLAEHRPFILDIEAERAGILAAVVGDGDRSIRCGVPLIIQVENMAERLRDAVIARQDDAGAQGVGGIERPRAFGLQTQRCVLFVGGLGNPVERQLGIPVRRIGQLRRPGEQRHLTGKILRRLQIGHDGVICRLFLVGIQVVTGEAVDAVDPITRAVVDRIQARGIGQLETLVGDTGDKGQAAVVVDNMVVIAEAQKRGRAVVQGCVGIIGAFDAELRLLVAERTEEGIVAVRAAIGDAGLVIAVTAAIDRHRAAVLQARLGQHIDDAGGAQAVLRRQGAGHQCDALGIARA